MSQSFGAYQPTHPHLGQLSYYLSRPLIKAVAATQGLLLPTSDYAQERSAAMRQKLTRGEPVYLLGIGAGGHNAGVSLVEVTGQGRLRLLCNNEEERFTGLKHYADYPSLSVEQLLSQLTDLGLRPTDIHACLANWDYIALLAHSMRCFWEEWPGSLALLKPQPRTTFLTDHRVILEALTAPRRLGQQLGLGRPLPLINLRHHDNHAYFAYAVSPFAHEPEPVMIAVIDGSGDDGSISLYLARQGRLTLLRNNGHMFDSLGTFYSMISATQGGWTPLSSEGRYMGAAAWGDEQRLTNPYYPRLRQLFYFGGEGQLYLNRRLANWQRGGFHRPYTTALTELLGPPILPPDMWNPDKVLRVEADNSGPGAFSRERVDKAAATQLVFEDGLFHIVGHLIRVTGSHRLILAGGVALNCLANMRLLDYFDEAYYERYLGQKQTRLQLWVPPIPGDSGTVVGAAYHFAMRQGASPGEPLQHAFYCGATPTTSQILAALAAEPEIAYLPLGNISEQAQLCRIADLLAYLVAQNGVVGLFQGAAETGPRALGHRSILANPCNPDTLSLLNERVKYRERLRPLAPMATPEAAHRWFELSPGAAANDYNAYNYMVLTVRARAEAFPVIPAVIHRDGTSRLQIVRREADPFTYAYLQALGRWLGVEVSVNTSLNVASPIVQTPAQALEALKRSRGLTGLVLIGHNGETFLAWHNIDQPPKDAGRQLKGWLAAWETGALLPGP